MMDATELSDKIRELIDRETLAANLGEEEACSMAIDALDEAGQP